jgi:hypothetical protein
MDMSLANQRRCSRELKDDSGSGGIVDCSRMAYADHFNLMSGFAKPEVDR